MNLFDLIWKRMAGNEQPNGRKDYLKDTAYFMAVAVLSAQRSKDPNTQVGACIVNQENKIVGTGYNRMPNGCENQLPWAREAAKWLDNKHAYVCHAELDAIMNSADVKGCSMYVSLFPCNECTKAIIQAGLKEVIYLSDKYHERETTIASRKMLNMAGIKFMPFVPRSPMIKIDINAIPPAAANQGKD